MVLCRDLHRGVQPLMAGLQPTTERTTQGIQLAIYSRGRLVLLPVVSRLVRSRRVAIVARIERLEPTRAPRRGPVWIWNHLLVPPLHREDQVGAIGDPETGNGLASLRVSHDSQSYPELSDVQKKPHRQE